MINRHFFKTGMRPHEPLQVCFKLDVVRDWKGWFECMGKRITGLLGPSAPHTFEFQRRDCSLDGVWGLISSIWDKNHNVSLNHFP